MKKSLVLIVFFLIIAGIVWLGFLAKKINFPVRQPADSGKIEAVATLFPLYDFAKIIGGNRANVSLLLPPGMEAHSFEPTPENIIRISNADTFIYMGDLMEPWAKDVLSGAGNKNLIAVNASGNLVLTGGDPHVWLDFSNAQKIADKITLAFSQKDAANSAAYFASAENLKNQLADLDKEFAAGLSHCETKTLIHGGHYAFGYLAKKYGLNYLAAQGFMPDSEPTARDLAELVSQIRAGGIKYIFYEELSSPKIAETISGETAAKLLMLNGAHNITKSDLEKGVSFIDIMKENLVNLKIGLGCR